MSSFTATEIAWSTKEGLNKKHKAKWKACWLLHVIRAEAVHVTVNDVHVAVKANQDYVEIWKYMLSPRTYCGIFALLI